MKAKPAMCPRCQQSAPLSGDAARECAFERRYFSRVNWQCATVNALRTTIWRLADSGSRWAWHWRDDMGAGSIGCLWVPDDATAEGDGFYIIATWYKNRGKTDQLWRTTEGSDRVRLSLPEAEAAIEYYKETLDGPV